MTPSPIKQVEVQIMGQTYTLACPTDGEDALREAVAKVDTGMCSIRDAGKVKARDRIAVLAALNIAYELSHRQAETSPFRNSSFGHTEAGDSSFGPDAQQTEARLQHLLHRLDAALNDSENLL